MPKRSGGGGRIGRYVRGGAALANALYNMGKRRGLTAAPVRGAGQGRRARLAATRLGATVLRYRKRKTNAAVQNVKPTPGLTSHSMFKANSRPDKRVTAMKRVGAPNYWVSNNAFQRIADEGFQEVAVMSWQDQPDIQDMIKKIPNNNPAVAGTYKTNRFVLDSTQVEVLITNSSLASTYVEIYDIVRKRDANATEFPYTANPFAAWQQGEYNATQVGVNDYKVINTSPFDSQIFRDWFKVVKRTRVELSQGSTHRHAVLLKPNKLINASLPNFVDGDFAGLTMYTMIVFKGQPASIPTDAGAVVTTAKIALDLVTARRYKYFFVQDTTETAYLTDNLSTLAGEQVVSTGAGAIVLNSIV